MGVNLLIIFIIYIISWAYQKRKLFYKLCQVSRCDIPFFSFLSFIFKFTNSHWIKGTRLLARVLLRKRIWWPLSEPWTGSHANSIMRVLRLPRVALELESGVRSAAIAYYSAFVLFFQRDIFFQISMKIDDPSSVCESEKVHDLRGTLCALLLRRDMRYPRSGDSLMRSHKANFFFAGKVHWVARWKRAKDRQFMSRNACRRRHIATWNSMLLFPRENFLYRDALFRAFFPHAFKARKRLSRILGSRVSAHLVVCNFTCIRFSLTLRGVVVTRRNRSFEWGF